jgi:peptide/nickel transport system ATP-binding protein
MPCDPAVANVLDIHGLVVRGPGGASLRLPRLSLAAGGAAALFAPSGGGKTTLLQAACGLLRRSGWSVEGRACVGGEDLLAADAQRAQALRRQAMAVLPQDAVAALDPLQPVGRWLLQATGVGPSAIAAALARLGVAAPSALAARLPQQISGGEAQRVLLAVALLRTPALVVADEPTANLDPDNRERVGAALRDLRRGGAALLLASHDAALLRALDAAVLAPADDAFVPAELPATAWPAGLLAGPAGDVVLALRSVRHGYGRDAVLDGVDLELRAGEIVAIVGASGAGKTTLARIAARRLAPVGGTVAWPAGPRTVQLLGQDAFGSLTPGRPLRSLLGEACAPGFDLTAGAQAVAMPVTALARPRERLSGGEQRRGALLRALAVAPAALVLDEPLAALDHGAALAVVDTLLELRAARQLALLLVTHDRELATAIAHRTLLLREGRLWPV